MKTALIAAPLLLAASLVGCNKPETPAETQKDVAEAQREGRADVAEAQRDAAGSAGVNGSGDPAGAGMPTGSMPQANRETAAEKAYDVEKAKAAAAYQVASEKCDALTGSARGSCLQAAEDERKAAEAMADSNRMKMQDGDGLSSPGASEPMPSSMPTPVPTPTP